DEDPRQDADGGRHHPVREHRDQHHGDDRQEPLGGDADGVHLRNMVVERYALAASSQSPYSDRYRPPRSSSSSWQPCSTTTPCSSTTIRSARRIVDSRCATTNDVRPASTVAIASSIRSSVARSTDDVASSRIRRRGSWSSARASATSCRWPIERRTP